MTTIAENLARVRERIEAAARRSGRDPQTVRLVTVSKTVDPERIRQAIEAGARVLGENYIQEAQRKISVLGSGITWHFIGHLQTNKVKKAVDLGFLDFTTLARRQFYCNEEIRLNSRMAPQIYVDVISIGGTPDHPVIGAQPAVEYAVMLALIIVVTALVVVGRDLFIEEDEPKGVLAFYSLVGLGLAAGHIRPAHAAHGIKLDHLVDERLGTLGGVALTPSITSQPVAELRLERTGALARRPTPPPARRRPRCRARPLARDREIEGDLVRSRAARPLRDDVRDRDPRPLFACRPDRARRSRPRVAAPSARALRPQTR